MRRLLEWRTTSFSLFWLFYFTITVTQLYNSLSYNDRKYYEIVTEKSVFLLLKSLSFDDAAYSGTVGGDM